MAAMNQPEPTLGQVRDEIVSSIKLGERVRHVELGQATTTVEVAGLRDQITGVREEQRTSRREILAAIESNKPKSPWPMIASLCAVLVIILAVAERLYAA